MYLLEKYNGRNRYRCPGCGAPKEFVRYVDEKGEHLAPHVGRCNREAKCGHHYTPGKYFEKNREPGQKDDGVGVGHKKKKWSDTSRTNVEVDFIPKEVLTKTLGRDDQNNFIKYLLSSFPFELVNAAIRRYFIGTWSDGRTVFWQIDAHRRIRTGKLMVYDATTGKRRKDRKPSWVHAELKRVGAIAQNFNLRQCLFGEHLIALVPAGKAVGVVESEKTAVVASVTMPNYVWVATGGAMNLRPEQLRSTLRGRHIVLFPDSSKFEAWSAKAVEARRVFGLNVVVSDLFERRLTAEEKLRDLDIADYLLAARMNRKV